MELERHVHELRRQLIAAAEPGDDATRRAAELLAVALDAATHLVLLDAIGEAAAEITRDLAPGSVEVHLHGREPDLRVIPPPADPPADLAAPATAPPVDDGTEAAMSRINLRLADHLKARVEEAADRDGISTNAWLVRAATAALDAGGPTPAPPSRHRPDRFTGWAR